jgi:CTP synthase
VVNKGGTMRLGAWSCDINENSIAYKVYKSNSILERHRHRFEFNNDYKDQIDAAGMKATGFNPDTKLVEIVEVENHPWFVGVQYHPEYKSTVANPHPLFVAFVEAALKYNQSK